MLSFPNLPRMHVPLATPSPDWRDLKVKHLVKDDHDKYILRQIRGVENIVNPNSSRFGAHASKRPVENEASCDVVKTCRKNRADTFRAHLV
jgi:hypothetical protein